MKNGFLKKSFTRHSRGWEKLFTLQFSTWRWQFGRFKIKLDAHCAILLGFQIFWTGPVALVRWNYHWNNGRFGVFLVNDSDEYGSLVWTLPPSASLSSGHVTTRSGDVPTTRTLSNDNCPRSCDRTIVGWLCGEMNFECFSTLCATGRRTRMSGILTTIKATQK